MSALWFEFFGCSLRDERSAMANARLRAFISGSDFDLRNFGITAFFAQKAAATHEQLSSMRSIELQCECGNPYSFDVEPGGNRVASAVICPACGADGTAAAKAVFAQSQRGQSTPAAATRAPLRVSVPARSE